jgi:hypothetical protein
LPTHQRTSPDNHTCAVMHSCIFRRQPAPATVVLASASWFQICSHFPVSRHWYTHCNPSFSKPALIFPLV